MSAYPMRHVVLLGDSIFDNAVYVPDGPPVIDQVRQCLSTDDHATLLAVDGDTIRDVFRQLDHIPPDASHLFLSVGGNDALRYGASLYESSQELAKLFERLSAMKAQFQQDYQSLLKAVLSLQKPTTLCTIYDQCPLLDPGMQILAFTALSMFNDCIIRQAVEANLPLIDLRVLCNHATDYSAISPIEPSVLGGAKIARAIARVVAEHDFTASRSVIYV